MLAHLATAPFVPKAELARRAELRSMRDFAGADQIRDALTGRGIVIEDTANGTRWWLADNAVSED